MVSRCIVLIEDNIAVADSLCMILESWGHTVYVAYDGSHGIEKALEVKPDFVLCDIGLPDIDGYQVAQTFKAHERLCSILLIAFSGYAQPDDIERSLTAGFHHHLVKPADFCKLEQLLLNPQDVITV